MTLSNTHDAATAGASDDLNGLGILLVEDSWHVGQAMKRLLQVMGADVAGPAATAADAERLLSDRSPDVAIVDVSLRGGERAYSLIDRLHDQGVRVIVISGYAEHPLASEKAVAILQKPVSEAQLFATLRPLMAQKAALSGVLPSDGGVHSHLSGNSIPQRTPSDANTRSTVPPSS
jgi:DNA-binding NtrC family response regulator